jgi:hypothetical protein
MSSINCNVGTNDWRLVINNPLINANAATATAMTIASA